MALEELLSVLWSVRERAHRYKELLQKNEALTRYVLIDPVLRALGWDTEDPEQVRPEFSTETGTPDYALLYKEEPYIMVEAKALGKQLEGAKDKAFQYAYQNGVPYFVTTDGLLWELYDVFKRDKDKRLFSISLDDGEGEAARQLLALWRPAMPEVSAPVKFLLEAREEKVSTRQKGENEFSISELFTKMKRGEIAKGAKPPKSIRFPDGQTKAIKYWRDLLVFSVEWLSKNASFPVPISFPSTGRILVAKTPEGMRAPKEVAGYYVETHASALYILQFLSCVLEKAHVDASKVFVTLPES